MVCICTIGCIYKFHMIFRIQYSPNYSTYMGPKDGQILQKTNEKTVNISSIYDNTKSQKIQYVIK